jgi:Ca2+-binding EF-hand superfamily protein
LSRPNGSDRKDKSKVKNFYKNQDLNEIEEPEPPKTELTKDDIASFAQSFNALNGPDGLLASTQLGLALKAVGHMPQKSRLTEILEEEAAGKSKLTFDEFVAIVKSLILNKSFQTKSVISVTEDVISIDRRAVPTDTAGGS